ncbi:hypothetical protein Tco_1389033, partial [Tanacetum coccineum]
MVGGNNKQMGLIVIGLMLLFMGTTTMGIELIYCCKGAITTCCYDANMPPATAMTPMSAFTGNKK